MKKFFVSVTLMTLALSDVSADKVTFKRYAYDEGDYIFETYATSPETPYATMMRPDASGIPSVYQFILLSEDVKPVYTFSVKAPEGYDNCAQLAWTNVGRDYYINEILVTQYLFNNDDLYEVIFEDEEGSKLIYNEKGDFLGEMPSKSDKLYKAGDKVYVYAEYEDGINTNYVSALYEINKGSDALMAVVAENSRLLASPNPVKTGETVVLALPEAVSSEMQIKIFNTNGVLLTKCECAIGETEISIPAYRLETGVNPVVVINSEGDIVYIGKIIRE